MGKEYQKIGFLYLFMGSRGMKKRRKTNYLAKCGAFSPAKAEGFCEFVRTTVLHTQGFSLRFSQSLNYLKEKSQGQIRGLEP